MSCGVVRRHRVDLVFQWLWHRPAATSLIRPLDGESPHAAGLALTKDKKKKKKKKQKWQHIFIPILQATLEN